MIQLKITRLAPMAMCHARRSSLLHQIYLVNPQNDEDGYELQKYLIIELRSPPEWPVRIKLDAVKLSKFRMKVAS